MRQKGWKINSTPDPPSLLGNQKQCRTLGLAHVRRQRHPFFMMVAPRASDPLSHLVSILLQKADFVTWLSWNSWSHSQVQELERSIHSFFQERKETESQRQKNFTQSHTKKVSKIWWIAVAWTLYTYALTGVKAIYKTWGMAGCEKDRVQGFSPKGIYSYKLLQVIKIPEELAAACWTN